MKTGDVGPLRVVTSEEFFAGEQETLKPFLNGELRFEGTSLTRSFELIQLHEHSATTATVEFLFCLDLTGTRVVVVSTGEDISKVDRPQLQTVHAFVTFEADAGKVLRLIPWGGEVKC